METRKELNTVEDLNKEEEWIMKEIGIRVLGEHRQQMTLGELNTYPTTFIEKYTNKTLKEVIEDCKNAIKCSAVEIAELKLYWSSFDGKYKHLKMERANTYFDKPKVEWCKPEFTFTFSLNQTINKSNYINGNQSNQSAISYNQHN